MQDYYEALDVPRTATAGEINAAYAARVKDLEGSRGTANERRAAERVLNTAFYVLSDAQKRGDYDRKLDSHLIGSEISSHFKRWGGIAAVVVALIGGFSYYVSDRAKTRERIRVEEVRLAKEAEATRARAAADEREAEGGERNAGSSERRAARPRRESSGYSDYNYRSQEDLSRYEAQQRQADDQRRAWQDRANEERDRYQAEADRQRAQGDVDRQKRYVQERQAEEDNARIRRHERVQQEERERAVREAPAAPPPDTSTPLDPRIRKK